MEPLAALRKVLWTGLLLLVVISLSACRPDSDSPGRLPAPEAVAASGSRADETPPALPTEAEAEPESVDARGASDAPDRESLDGRIARLAPRPEEPEQPQADEPAEEAEETEAAKPMKTADLLEPLPSLEGESEPLVPLVDDPDTLERLDPSDPVWFDRKRKQVVMVGRVCQRQAPLELFACVEGSKEHESVVSIGVKPYVVHAGLLAAGAEPGSPVRFMPEFAPASGPEIEITVVWEDEAGARHRARAQDWVRDVGELYTMFEGVIANPFDDELNVGDQVEASKDMEQPWVFAGSRFVENDQTGERFYQADAEGDLICVSNFPSAVLDVPIRSSDSNASLLFEAYTERIPPLGSPVTLLLRPVSNTPKERGRLGSSRQATRKE